MKVTDLITMLQARISVLEKNRANAMATGAVMLLNDIDAEVGETTSTITQLQLLPNGGGVGIPLPVLQAQLGLAQGALSIAQADAVAEGNTPAALAVVAGVQTVIGILQAQVTAAGG